MDLTEATCCDVMLTQYNLSRVVRKPAFSICENKDANQLRGDREADQRLCFRYMDSTIFLLPKSKFQTSSHLLWCGCTARFVWDLVGNPEDRFSHTEAHLRINHDFHIHGPPMSSLYALEDNDPVLLRTTQSNHIIYSSRMLFCA